MVGQTTVARDLFSKGCNRLSGGAFWLFMGFGLNKRRPTCHDSGSSTVRITKASKPLVMNVTESQSQCKPEQIVSQLGGVIVNPH